jgi:prepilin-type N-terminal cleavage/methylation domain-containing protein
MQHSTYTHRSRAGVSLVELIIVMAVIGLLAAISVPALANLGAFSRDELRSSSRELYSLLRAARIYATTHHVQTAVVYSLDNYDPVENDLDTPARDSISGETVRYFTSVAMMYRIPGSLSGAGNFRPVENEYGQFRRFPGDMTVMLRDVDSTTKYYSDTTTSLINTGAPAQLGTLGLRIIPVYLPGEGLLSGAAVPNLAATRPFAAHVFRPSGDMDTGAARERYEIYVAPPPTASADMRLREPKFNILFGPETNGTNMVHIPLELFRSTGRVRIQEEPENG